MKKALKILIISASRRNFGYIIPSLSLACQLKQRGHEVLLTCHKESVSIPQKFKINYREVDELGHTKIFPKNLTPEWLKQNFIARAVDYASVKRFFEEERQVIREFKPDLVITNLRLSGCIAAKLENIPSLAIQNTNILNLMPEWLEKFTETMVALQIPREDAGKLFGHTLLIPDFSMYSPINGIDDSVLKIIIRNVKEIKHIGPCLLTNPYKLASKHELKKSLLGNTDTPFIYITLGGSNNVSKTLIKVLENLNVTDRALNIFITTGFNSREDYELISSEIKRLQQLNGRLNIKTEEFTDVSMQYMKAADLAIIHGGHSTTMEAQMCGTPIIGFPKLGEQKTNIQRLVRNGSGLVINLDNNEEGNLVEYINRILETPLFLHNAQQAASLLEKLYNTDVVLDYLEFMAGQKEAIA